MNWHMLWLGLLTPMATVALLIVCTLTAVKMQFHDLDPISSLRPT